MKAANMRILLFLKCNSSDRWKKAYLLFASLLMVFLISGCSEEKLQAENTVREVSYADTITPEENLSESIRFNEPSEGYEEPSVQEEVKESETNSSTTESTKMPSYSISIAKTELDDYQLVRVVDYIPRISTDLKYATNDNFTGEKIYEFADAYLRYGTVKKLKQAEIMLEEQGYCLKIWDAYRPVSAQFKLWEICPNSTYVANPYNGYSSHSRGNTVDITLLNADGTEIPMPTGFDDFSAKADRDYNDCAEEAAKNSRLLESVMIECGFQPYFGEWWHFSDQTFYDVEKNFEPT